MPGLETTDEMFDLRMSEGAKPLFEQVVAFVAAEVEPNTREFFRLGEDRSDRWSWAPGQLELLDSLKAKAKEQGLWNFFLPDAETGEGLSEHLASRRAVEAALEAGPVPVTAFRAAMIIGSGSASWKRVKIARRV